MIQQDITAKPSIPGHDPRFARLRIVLVGTTHPGNIGSTARAMKTMGLARLILVAPKARIDAEAEAMASGATDVLRSAQIVDSLDAALIGCHWVVGASARLRDAPHELLTVRQAAVQAIRELAVQEGEVALVFGREHAGLTNAELGRCHAHMIIPAHPEYSSLNLAQAVQVTAYELRQALLEDEGLRPAVELPAPAPHDAVENLLAHWQAVLEGLGFLDPANPRHLMQKLRHLLQRARITPNEVDILRGMLTAVQKKMKN
ncbi:MAG: RNA methyltransferase [Gammaproteobacteria bacterium]|nr:RNA methyltransferase [Gammaproteobacteria bacterium]